MQKPIKNPIKMDDLGVSPILETSIYQNPTIQSSGVRCFCAAAWHDNGVLIKIGFLLRGNDWLRLKIALPTLRPDIFDG